MASTAQSTLPMPTPTVARKPLISFRLLSFDIYGTLVDWETAIVTALEPLLSHLPPSSPHDFLKSDRIALAGLFNRHESALQAEQPTLRYDKILTEVYLRMARELNVSYQDQSQLNTEATRFGDSVGDWQAFSDTVGACKRLSKFYKLVALSNVDRASFEKTLNGQLHDAGLIDELCLTLSPLLVGTDAARVIDGAALNVQRLSLDRALEEDGWLFLRYVRR